MVHVIIYVVLIHLIARLASSLFFLASVDVDLDHPECNGEVLVIPVLAPLPVTVGSNQKKIHGIQILIDGANYHDYRNDIYNASVVGPNHVLVEMPSVKHNFLDQDTYKKTYEAPSKALATARGKETLGHGPEISDAHKSLQADISKDPQRKLKKILLRFPPDIEISCKHFCKPVGSNYVLDGPHGPVHQRQFAVKDKQGKKVTDNAGKAVTMIESSLRLSWLIGYGEEVDLVVNKKAKKNEMDGIAASFGGLKLEVDDDSDSDVEAEANGMDE